MNLLAALSPEQCDAVLHGDGPAVVFAGAGSGKTRTLTTRIARLVAGGIAEQRILAVTFTNKAAAEMRHRTEALLERESRVVLGTFHSLCARWLRRFAPRLGFPSDFAILDAADAKTLLQTVCRQMGEAVQSQLAKPAAYLAAIDTAKRHRLTPEQLADSALIASLPLLSTEVYSAYQKQLRNLGAFDFGDLIFAMTTLLSQDEAVARVVRGWFDYVMVDEFQDTNPVQSELIHLVLSPSRNLMVVGDDDQSIYSWRGAVPRHIIDFTSRYPGARVIHLEHNYRCSGNIIAAAAGVIAHNTTRVAKRLWTTNPAGAPLRLLSCFDPRDEADKVTLLVDMAGPERWTQCAVLYRTNAQSRVLEECLVRHRIPYRIYGGHRFYDRAEVKDALAYLRLLVRPEDNWAFERVVGSPPRGIGVTTLSKLKEAADQANSSLYAQARVGAGGGKARQFADWLANWHRRNQEERVGQAEQLRALLGELDYVGFLRRKFPDKAEEKIENVFELLAALSEYEQASDGPVDLSSWFEQVALSGSEDERTEGVHLMTLHAAKGLEFEDVYLVGVEDGVLPHRNALSQMDQLEEERRLMYVGMTRARRTLTLCHVQRRASFGGEFEPAVPSRFLAEIPSQVIEGATATSSSGAPLPEPELKPGARVDHVVYGAGTIESVGAETGGATRFLIVFDAFGRRRVDGKYVQLL